MERQLERTGLPTLHRFVTDHDDKGNAIFRRDVEEILPWQSIGETARFALGYATNQFPVDMNGSKDIKAYKHYQENLPGITIPGGTVLRIVDMPPGSLSPMHRTISLDYGVVLEGTIQVVLDSGEVRTLRRGDVTIQRGTNHAWRNTSPDTWARMMYVLQESKPVTIASKRLGEDYGNMEGVKPSGH
jgi:quercetin dioxygenase-like cupin family protein